MTKNTTQRVGVALFVIGSVLLTTLGWQPGASAAGATARGAQATVVFGSSSDVGVGIGSGRGIGSGGGAGPDRLADSGSTGKLAITGTASLVTMLSGLGLMMAGIALVVLGRRNHNNT